LTVAHQYDVHLAQSYETGENVFRGSGRFHYSSYHVEVFAPKLPIPDQFGIIARSLPQKSLDKQSAPSCTIGIHESVQQPLCSSRQARHTKEALSRSSVNLTAL
jgi:hypothetical protein